MRAVSISQISYIDLNMFCISALVFFGLLAVVYMKHIDTKVSGFLIVIGSFYNVALICDSIRALCVEKGIRSTLLAYVSVMYRGSIWIAASFWLIFVVTRVFPQIRKKYYWAMGVFFLPAFVTIVLSTFYATKDYYAMDTVGTGVYNRIWFLYQVYGPDLYYVAAGIFALIMLKRYSEKSETDKRERVIAMAIFPVPLVIADFMQYATGKNFKCLGYMVALTMFVCLRLFSLDKSQRRSLEHFADIMDSLKKEYAAIIYVNLDKNKFEPYMINGERKSEYGKRFEKMTYTEMVKNYAEYSVYTADQDRFIDNLLPEKIKEQLKETDFYSVGYRFNNEGDLEEYEADIWRARDNGEMCVHAVLGFIDRSKEKAISNINERRNSIIKGIVEGYEYVCFMNFANGECEEYRATDAFKNMLNRMNGDTLSDKLEQLFDKCCPPEEHEEMKQLLSFDYVLDIIGERDEYEQECRLDLGDGYRYHHLRFTPDSNNPECIILGIMDVDEQVRAEVEKGEKAKVAEYNIQLEATITDRTFELHEKAKSLNQINEDIIELLGNITEARDTESGEHIRRVKGFTNILANHIMQEFPQYGLTPDKIELITSASALHDIGKIMIPDDILRKPARFTDDEYAIMQTHCERGCQILEKAPSGWSKDYLDFSMEICHYHHEKWDGKGYPQGLKGEEIPISAQIVAVADCFDALTTKRVYKDAIEPEVAINMILEGQCGAFSDNMKKALILSKEEFFEHVNNKASIFTSKNAGGLSSHSLTDAKLMLVEDNEFTRSITKDLLEEEGAHVTEAENGEEALQIIKDAGEVVFDAILMDLILPHMDGFETTEKIRALEKEGVKRADSVPIIAVTASPDKANRQKALEAGMSDYITKPVSAALITRLLLSSMRMEQNLLQNKLEVEVTRANTDSLTGVKNTTAYADEVSRLTHKLDSMEHARFAIVQCDVNHLKKVNDEFGHDVGDMYIKNCCQLMTEAFPNSEIYRTGGDEFQIVVIGEDYDNKNVCMDNLIHIIEQAEKIDTFENGKASLAAGIAIYDPKVDEGVGGVAKRADAAMYQNKRLRAHN